MKNGAARTPTTTPTHDFIDSSLRNRMHVVVLYCDIPCREQVWNSIYYHARIVETMCRDVHDIYRDTSSRPHRINHRSHESPCSMMRPCSMYIMRSNISSQNYHIHTNINKRNPQQVVVIIEMSECVCEWAWGVNAWRDGRLWGVYAPSQLSNEINAWKRRAWLRFTHKNSATWY